MIIDDVYIWRLSDLWGYSKSSKSLNHDLVLTPIAEHLKKTWTHLDMLTILDPKFFVDGFGPIWRQTYDLPKNCDKLGSRGARGAPVDPN